MSARGGGGTRAAARGGLACLPHLPRPVGRGAPAPRAHANWYGRVALSKTCAHSLASSVQPSCRTSQPPHPVRPREGRWRLHVLRARQHARVGTGAAPGRRKPRLGRALRGVGERDPRGLCARSELGCREYLPGASKLALSDFGACPLALAFERNSWVELHRRLGIACPGTRGSEELSPHAALERCCPREEQCPALPALLLQLRQQHARGEQESFPCSGPVL